MTIIGIARSISCQSFREIIAMPRKSERQTFPRELISSMGTAIFFESATFRIIAATTMAPIYPGTVSTRPKSAVTTVPRPTAMTI